jgi:hypothetical protein
MPGPIKKKFDDITRADLELVWKLKPDDSIDNWAVGLQFTSMRSKIPESEILAKFKQYLDMCGKEGRESKYIKRFKNFLDEGMYQAEFIYSNKSGNIAKTWLEGLPQ